jgi:hypothetical protein
MFCPLNYRGNKTKIILNLKSLLFVRVYILKDTFLYIKIILLKMDNSIKVLLSARITIFLVLLILIGIFNVPSVFIDTYEEHEYYFDALKFINGNLSLFLILGILFIISGFLWILNFPLNILAPLLTSSVIITSIEFFYRILLYSDKYFSILKEGFDLRKYYTIIIIVLVIYFYIKLFYELFRYSDKDIIANLLVKIKYLFKLCIYKIKNISRSIFSNKSKIKKIKFEKEEFKKQEITKPEVIIKPKIEILPEIKEKPIEKKIVNKNLVNSYKNKTMNKLQESIFRALKYLVSGVISITDYFRGESENK